MVMLLHLGKFDPSREGLQVVTCHEGPDMYGDCGTEMRDAATGEVLVAIPGNGQDVGRCMVADIDPETPGCEIWASEPAVSSIHVKGKCWQKSPRYKWGDNWTYNMGIWWSGSLNRQLLDRGFVVDYGTGGEPNVLFSKGDYNVTTGQGTKE